MRPQVEAQEIDCTPIGGEEGEIDKEKRNVSFCFSVTIHGINSISILAATDEAGRHEMLTGLTVERSRLNAVFVPYSQSPRP